MIRLNTPQWWDRFRKYTEVFDNNPEAPKHIKLEVLVKVYIGTDMQEKYVQDYINSLILYMENKK